MTPPAMLILMATFVAPLAAHAASPPRQADVSRAFGNTLMTVDPDGRTRSIWLQKDGSWTGLSRRGLNLAGTWTTQGDKVCLSQAKPKLPGKLCETFPSDLGSGVETENPAGGSVQLKLVKGHVTK
jgi:hypothetical protein